MKVLVLGGTGTVGSNVTQELRRRGADVRVLTRDPAKAKSLGAGIEAVKGDLNDPDSARPAFEGVDGMFLLNPVSPTEANEGLVAVALARQAGVKRIVYMSVHRIDEAAYLPHFGSKIGVEAGVRNSGAEWTILRPNNFYQNDAWLRPAIEQHGIYPQPLGSTGVSRVDVRDIAEAAAIALTQGDHGGQTYDLGGPTPWTGSATAEVWSRALGKPVKYAGDDLDAWAQGALQFMPAWMVFDFGMMYAHFQKNGLLAQPGAVERLSNLLGHPPRKFEDYAMESVKVSA